MSPPWAQVLAGNAKASQMRHKFTSSAKLVKVPQAVCNSKLPERPERVECESQPQNEQGHMNLTSGHFDGSDSLDHTTSMNHVSQGSPSPTPEKQTSQVTGDVRNSRENDIRVRITDDVYETINSNVFAKIVDYYFRSNAVQIAMSHAICADPFCKEQIPVRCIKGRWATCDHCSQKTCVMSSCSFLERSHLNNGWEICPDGAAAMGFERIARAKKWKRCEQCHCFLVKVESGEQGKDLPCFHCDDASKGRA